LLQWTVRLNQNYSSLKLFVFFLNREYNLNQGGGFDLGKDRNSKNAHYSSTNRTLAIVLPIIAVLVVAGAIAIIILYYKNLRNVQNKDGKSVEAVQSKDKYSGKFIKR
jgi:hypothetical protein